LTPPSSGPAAPGAPARLHAVVHGRVQGVGFRATTEYEARKLGLRGWVRNLFDGGVEVDAEGDRTHLEKFLAFLHRGPLGAHVDAVQAEWLAADGGAPFPFEVRRTT
jgi:acylphosphatase